MIKTILLGRGKGYQVKGVIKNAKFQDDWIYTDQEVGSTSSGSKTNKKVGEETVRNVREVFEKN